jgi:hypothetical protein
MGHDPLELLIQALKILNQYYYDEPAEWIQWLTSEQKLEGFNNRKPIDVLSADKDEFLRLVEAMIP